MNKLLFCFPLITLILVNQAFAAGSLDRAKGFLPLYDELRADHWPDMPLQQIPCGQVEQESSWNERATLKTSRELGRGLTQMTIAYRSDGSERFNIYKEATAKFRVLRDWNWRADPYNVRYQLTFLILQDRRNFVLMTPMFRDDTERWKAALVCYNAGLGRVLSRRAEAKSRDSPVDIWTGGLDRSYGLAEKKLLYGRPLWQVVNEYPVKVFQRAEKYRGFLYRK